MYLQVTEYTFIRKVDKSLEYRDYLVALIGNNILLKISEEKPSCYSQQYDKLDAKQNLKMPKNILPLKCKLFLQGY